MQSEQSQAAASASAADICLMMPFHRCIAAAIQDYVTLRDVQRHLDTSNGGALLCLDGAPSAPAR